MTQHKHLKQLVRARMEKTGESYSTARRHITAQIPAPQTQTHPHFAGNIPAATALRVLLNAVGVRAPHTAQPYTEAMTFGLAGGIGIGVFAFFYETADFASFYLAGRHLWHDFAAYFTRAAERLGAQVIVKEASGSKPAEKALRDLLSEHGTCSAWVDAAALPHRALPADLSGGAYHVITVYSIDDARQTATIGDLTDEPITISLKDLAAARSRIKKDKNRVLALRAPTRSVPLSESLPAALAACHAGLLGDGAPANARRNFSLDVLGTWVERLRDSKGKESWARVFAPPRLWNGLTSIYDCIEHSMGTGGGLSRPLFAEFLTEAAAATRQKPLARLAEKYNELGAEWSALADVALPMDVPLFRSARELYARKAELVSAGSPADTAELRDVQQKFQALAQKAVERFPLTDADCSALRATLAERVSALQAAEVAAHAALLKPGEA
jgi:Domain of unknown function (DUF4872)/Butirosin biosynthesis protein H, N-terminal